LLFGSVQLNKIVATGLYVASYNPVAKSPAFQFLSNIVVLGCRLAATPLGLITRK